MGLHLTGSSVTQLNNAFARRWTANTAYTAGDTVVAPDGSVVKAKTNFTSGSSYSASNWTSTTLTTGTVQLAAYWDGTSAIDTAYASALAALPTVNSVRSGTIIFPAGVLTVAAPLPNCGPQVSLTASPFGTILNFTGTGDCLRAYYTGLPTSFDNVAWGGSITGFVIDGTNAGAGSVGLHYGDMLGGRIDVEVINFTGTGSIGFLIENTVSWTEKVHARLISRNNATAVQFSVGGATTSTDSFGYNDFYIELFAHTGQNGVVLANGANYYHGRLDITANMQESATTLTNIAALTITGSIPAGHANAGNKSTITGCWLRVVGECGTSQPNSPQTILFGTTAQNALLGCIGILSFNNMTASNNDPTSNATTVKFSGFIKGDTNLNPAGVSTKSAWTTLGATSRTRATFSSGSALMDTGDFFMAANLGLLTANLTVAFNNQHGGPIEKTFIFRQATSGGPWTVTWPAGIKWAAGTAHVMTTTAGSVDIVKVWSTDGTTYWAKVVAADCR